jgi:hypothetical protein
LGVREEDWDGSSKGHHRSYREYGAADEFAAVASNPDADCEHL